MTRRTWRCLPGPGALFMRPWPSEAQDDATPAAPYPAGQDPAEVATEKSKEATQADLTHGDEVGTDGLCSPRHQTHV